ncbi:uncharacterized protein LOC135383261 [Ornithodoros turicata]|uniref:uncharacterized protein LOC135383261 n=1 Tax=Ornithodoros turicata TaxID=34597 RepID=UPI003139D497
MISDRLKEEMSEEMQSVLQGEVNQWLRPRELVSAAENFEESWQDVADARRRGGVTRGYQNGHVRADRDTARPRRTGDSDDGNPRRCFHCGRSGHMRRACPELQRGSEGQRSLSRADGPRRLVAKVGFQGTDGTVRDRADWVDIAIEGRAVTARVDSGADVTVVHPRDLPAKCWAQAGGVVQLKGAFGAPVEAELRYLDIALKGENRGVGVSPQCRILCAITSELSDDVGALITPQDYEELTRAVRRAKSEAEEMFAIERQVDAGAGMTTMGEHVELEDSVAEESREAGAVVGANSVGVTGECAEPSDLQFAREQREDTSLSDAWEQARSKIHGMLIENGVLFHMEDVNGKRPQSRRETVLELAHDRPIGGHLSGKKTRARIRSSFYWPTLVADVNKYCASCHMCQTFAHPRVSDRVPITPLTRPEQPFQIVYIDCIGPLEPASARGHRYALCLVDLCTRWAEVIPLRALTAKAYDPWRYVKAAEGYEVLDTERARLKLENTVRWRCDDCKMENRRPRGNARIVRWLDGSMSVHLSSEIFHVHKQSDFREGIGLEG